MGLAYERMGSGPPLVLLHGVGHRRQAWGAVLDRLTPHRDVIIAEVPVTIAWGTKDRMLRPPQVLVAKARLPQARIRPLPGCGHVPMTDDPALVADILLQGSGRLGGQPA